MRDEFTIFSGSSNPELARAIARELGRQPDPCETERFPDGELSVRLLTPVRRREVFLVQPTSPPVNEHLVELLALADASRRAAAAHITAIVPYFGYARSDKRHGRREPIMGSMVAGLMQSAGIGHVVTIDMHAPQIEGFFHIPVDSLTAMPVLSATLHGRLAPDTVVVSPDAGAMRMATRYAQRLATSVVVLHKQRESGTETEVTHLVGDVRGRACLIVDDMISTGGTMAESIDVLLEAGARPEITIAATHGLLLEGAHAKLSHPAVREVLVTDTVTANADRLPNLRVVSIASLLASAIRRFMEDGSLSDLL